MKLVILLLIFGIITPVFAQEPTLNDVETQLGNQVNQENLERLEERVSDLEHKFSNEDSTTYFLNSFLVPTLQVAIPAIVGAIITIKVTTSWQKKKEIYSIKKGILDEFDNSFIYVHNSMSKCDLVIFTRYTETNSNSKIDPNDLSFKNVDIGTKQQFPPKKTFESLYNDFINEYAKGMNRIWKFNTILQMHYTEEFDKLYLNLSLLIELARFQLIREFDSLNANELTISHNNFYIQARKLEKDIQEFKVKLVQEKIEKTITD